MISRCAACLRPCEEAFLSECLLCGEKFCGIGDCPSTCGCSDNVQKPDVDEVFRLYRNFSGRSSILLVFDGAGICTFQSAETGRMIGHHLGKPVWQMFPGEFCDRMYEKIALFLGNNRPTDALYPILCGKKQRYFHLSIVNFSANAPANGGFCVGADVTDLLVGKSKTPLVVNFSKTTASLWRPSVFYDA